MGGCLSTQGKSRRYGGARSKHSNKKRRPRRKNYGNLKFAVVRPVQTAHLTRKHGSNMIAKDFLESNTSSDFVTIDVRPVAHSCNVIEHMRLETDEKNLSNTMIIETPIARLDSRAGSKRETFFDTDDIFNNESDDDYLSVCGDSHCCPSIADMTSQRLASADLQVTEMFKVDNWMAGTSKQVGSLHSPPPEHAEKNCTTFGTVGVIRNGIAALAGNAQDDLRSGEEDVSPGRRSFYMTTAEERVVSSPHKCERAAEPGTGLHGGLKHDIATNSPEAILEDDVRSEDYKGVFDGICLPRLRTVVSSAKSRQLSPISVKKRSIGVMRFSFKRRMSMDLPTDYDNLSPKYHVERPLERPLGDFQVGHCSPSKPMDGCWCKVEPSLFKLRGKHYLKDKKKFAAPSFSAFVPIGVDLLMSSQKIDHIAQYVELPFQDSTYSTDTLPAVLIVNIQLPLYPPTIFMNETNGEGLSLVLYFKLSNELAKATPKYLKDTLRKFVNDEMEKVKGFVGDSLLSFRDRLKIVARLVNPEEVQLSVAEKKLLVTYNEKPILSRPQHCFYKEANYLEVDLDVHRFSYIARKGFDTLRERLKNCILDIGLTIQGTKPDELPEQILAAIRLHKLDFDNYRILQTASSRSSSNRSPTTS